MENTSISIPGNRDIEVFYYNFFRLSLKKKTIKDKEVIPSDLLQNLV